MGSVADMPTSDYIETNNNYAVEEASLIQNTDQKVVTQDLNSSETRYEQNKSNIETDIVITIEIDQIDKIADQSKLAVEPKTEIAEGQKSMVKGLLNIEEDKEQISVSNKCINTINSNIRKILEDEDTKIETKHMSAYMKYKQQDEDKECLWIAIFKNNLELIQEQNLTDFDIKVVDFLLGANFMKLNPVETAEYMIYLINFGKIKSEVKYMEIQRLCEENRLYERRKLPDHSDRMSPKMKQAIPFALPIENRLQVAIIVRILQFAFDFDRLPDCYFNDNRDIISEDSKSLLEQFRSIFPLTLRRELKLVSELKEKLREFYIVKKLPDIYFDLLGPKPLLLCMLQELPPRLQRFFPFFPKDRKDFNESEEVDKVNLTIPITTQKQLTIVATISGITELPRLLGKLEELEDKIKYINVLANIKLPITAYKAIIATRNWLAEHFYFKTLPDWIFDLLVLPEPTWDIFDTKLSDKQRTSTKKEDTAIGSITNSDYKIIQVTWETKFETRQSRQKKYTRKMYDFTQMMEEKWKKFQDNLEGQLGEENIKKWSMKYRESTKKYEKAALGREESRKNMEINQCISKFVTKRYNNFKDNTLAIISSILKKKKAHMSFKKLITVQQQLTEPQNIIREH
ncbi:33374_t:CDS:2 [Gigaspora margarita]|uniref:33374_t:CDS:1 n=1 Tax=Gigaspora margarita TaxID=4874 RepID=A0ABM8VWV0_GIGMA|nr:33374_t:CDS:2 [Gigaspora margarita]